MDQWHLRSGGETSSKVRWSLLCGTSIGVSKLPDAFITQWYMRRKNTCLTSRVLQLDLTNHGVRDVRIVHSRIARVSEQRAFLVCRAGFVSLHLFFFFFSLFRACFFCVHANLTSDAKD